MKPREFVSLISKDELLEMVQNHLQFERDGFIGDCALRSRAEELMTINRVPNHNVVAMMGYLYTATLEVLLNDAYQELGKELIDFSD